MRHNLRSLRYTPNPHELTNPMNMKLSHLPFLLAFFASCAASAFAGRPIILDPERANHTATLLSDGTVLLTGGVNENGSLDSGLTFDPAGRRQLVATNPMTSVRSEHTATLLPDGKVLVAGGELSSGQALKSSELYDPTTRTFTAIAKAMAIPRTQTHRQFASQRPSIIGRR